MITDNIEKKWYNVIIEILQNHNVEFFFYREATMYLNKIKFKNYGPIDEMEIIARFNEDGSPCPIIFTGKNGTGKTLTISQILQAILTYKNDEYNDIPEKEQHQLYKTQSSSYIKTGNEFSSTYISFDSNENYYLELYSNNPQKSLDDNVFLEYTNELNNNSQFKNDGIFSKKIGKINYSNSLCLYFPADRYYIPGWINKNSKSEVFYNNQRKEERKLFTDNRIIGKTNRNIICKTIQDDLESYILNTIIDQQIYDKKIYIQNNGTFVTDSTGNPKLIYIGKNNSIIEFINFIISKFNNNNYKLTRLYVSPKGNRKIGILGEKHDGSGDEIIDSLSKLSTGEYSILSMFMAILMDYEKTMTNDSFNFQDIKGLVIIDEAELNLHVNLQTKVLPELIKKFKNIQFIITTQSPFLIYGMKDLFKENCDIYDMPGCIKMDDITELEEVKQSYNTFIDHNYELHNLIEKAKNEIQDSNNYDLIVYTEGKSDVNYLRKAQSKFKEYGNIKIKYIGLGTPEANKYKSSGNGGLDKLADALSTIDMKIPIILLYDSDVKIKNLGNNKYINFFGNIYKMPIPTPSFRSGKEISIEHYFKDDEIKRNDSDGHRMFIGNEFNENGLSIDGQFMTKACTKCGKNSNKILDGSNDTKVYLKNDIKNVNLALSKNKFSENILNDVDNFNDFDFSEFKNIFQIFLEIKNIRD